MFQEPISELSTPVNEVSAVTSFEASLYASDWPERGDPHPHSPLSATPDPPERGSNYPGVDLATGAVFNLNLRPDSFESELYGMACVSLSLQVVAPLESDIIGSESLRDSLQDAVDLLLNDLPNTPTYLNTKVVEGEPLHEVLVSRGFDKVEERCIFRSLLSDLDSARAAEVPSNIEFLTMADIAPSSINQCREQIQSICRESFSPGNSRHFHDPQLFSRVAGEEYIRRVMQLNFDHLPLDRFILAYDNDNNGVCAFSIVAEKSVGDLPMFTQLLSAVRPTHRGNSIYHGITDMLVKSLPAHSVLLNVTHAKSRAMQVAFGRTNRGYLTNTQVVRRVLHTD